MSNLRNQLDSAKTAYLKAKYPGDLASELLPPVAPVLPASSRPSSSLTSRRWFWAGGAGSAIAAALVGAFLLNSSTPPQGPLNPDRPQVPMTLVPSGYHSPTGGAYETQPVVPPKMVASPATQNSDGKAKH